MKIELSKELFDKFPEAVRYVLVVKGIDNTGDCAELEAMLREAEERVRQDDSFIDIKANPFIAAWRDAFQKFDMNANKFPPSVANLIKRTKSGNNLPFINKLVCIFNIISLKYICPCGGDDLAKITGDLCLGLAKGDELYTPLGGAGEKENPKPNEIIFYDTITKEVMCRGWCWKNGDTTKIEPITKDAALNIDILSPATLEMGKEAAELMKGLIKKYCGGTSVLYKLDRENNSYDI